MEIVRCRRSLTWARLFELAEERTIRNIVETGSIRLVSAYDSDGHSTLLFARYAAERGGYVVSVDVNPRCAELIDHVCKGALRRAVAMVTADSVAFLGFRPLSIDLLYLDSLDFQPHDPLKLAQRHNLSEFMAAESALSPEAIVAIDDYRVVGRSGKADLTVPYMLGRGWRIAAEGYQVILVRGRE